jgi:hypothetical protein
MCVLSAATNLMKFADWYRPISVQRVLRYWAKAQSAMTNVSRLARTYAGAIESAVAGTEDFFVRRSIASCNSPTSKGFASIMSTCNSS